MIVKYKSENLETIIDNIIEVKKFYHEKDEGKLENIIAFRKPVDGIMDNDIRIAGAENIEKFKYIYVMDDKGQTIERIK